MERLLWTPEQIANEAILPYCAETIRRKVRAGELRTIKRSNNRILIHIDDLKAYAAEFSSLHTTDRAGQRASDKEDACRVKRKASSRGKTRGSTGHRSLTPAAAELGNLLGLK